MKIIKVWSLFLSLPFQNSKFVYRSYDFLFNALKIFACKRKEENLTFRQFLFVFIKFRKKESFYFMHAVQKTFLVVYVFLDPRLSGMTSRLFNLISQNKRQNFKQNLRLNRFPPIPWQVWLKLKIFLECQDNFLPLSEKKIWMRLFLTRQF